MNLVTPEKQDGNINRRSLVRGAAWAAPAVVAASAVPAYAASQCVYQESSWANSGSSGANLTGTLAGTTKNQVVASGTNLDNSVFSTTRNGYTKSLGALPVYPNQAWYTMSQSGDNQRGKGSTLTLTFPRTVYCLSFWIQDIDSQQTIDTSDRYQDGVRVSSSGATWTATPYSAAVGNVTVTPVGTGVEVVSAYVPGTSGSDNSHEGAYQTEAIGLVRFDSAGPVNSVTIDYWNEAWMRGTDWNHQQIYVSTFRYSTDPCNCTS